MPGAGPWRTGCRSGIRRVRGGTDALPGAPLRVGRKKITSSLNRLPTWTPDRSSAGNPGTAGPRSACSPTSTSPSPSPCNASEIPAQTGIPDWSRSPFRNCWAPARHCHPIAPARPGPPAALAGLATPPPVPRPPSPPTLEHLRRDNTVITTNYSCRNRSRSRCTPASSRSLSDCVRHVVLTAKNVVCADALMSKRFRPPFGRESVVRYVPRPAA